MEREAKRAAKVEHKVNILLGGLQQRDTAARAKIVELAEQLQSAQIELTCFKVWGQTGGAASLAPLCLGTQASYSLVLLPGFVSSLAWIRTGGRV